MFGQISGASKAFYAAMFAAGVLFALPPNTGRAQDQFNSNGAAADRAFDDCNRQKDAEIIALKNSYRQGAYQKINEERIRNRAEKQKRDLSCVLIQDTKERQNCLMMSNREFLEKQTDIDKEQINAEVNEQIEGGRIMNRSCSQAVSPRGSQASLPSPPVDPAPFKSLTEPQKADLRKNLTQLQQCQRLADAAFKQQLSTSRVNMLSDVNDCIQKGGDSKNCEQQANLKQLQRQLAIETKAAQVLSSFDTQQKQIQAMLRSGGYITNPNLLPAGSCPSP